MYASLIGCIENSLMVVRGKIEKLLCFLAGKYMHKIQYIIADDRVESLIYGIVINKHYVLFIDDGVELLNFTFDLGFDFTVGENLNIAKRHAVLANSMSHELFALL